MTTHWRAHWSRSPARPIFWSSSPRIAAVQNGTEVKATAEKKLGPNTNTKRNIITAIWQLPQFIIIQCMTCPVNQSTTTSASSSKGWRTHISLPCGRVRDALGLSLLKCMTFLQVTYELFFISLSYVRSLTHPSSLSHTSRILWFALYVSQIRLAQCFFYLKGSIKPRPLLSKGIDNVIFKIRIT